MAEENSARIQASAAREAGRWSAFAGFLALVAAYIGGQFVLRAAKEQSSLDREQHYVKADFYSGKMQALLGAVSKELQTLHELASDYAAGKGFDTSKIKAGYIYLLQHELSLANLERHSLLPSLAVGYLTQLRIDIDLMAELIEQFPAVRNGELAAPLHQGGDPVGRLAVHIITALAHVQNFEVTITKYRSGKLTKTHWVHSRSSLK